MRRSLLIAFLALSASPVWSDALDDRLERGYAMLGGGEATAALDHFRDMLTDYPDSDSIQYAIAASMYEEGLRQLESGDEAAGLKGLAEAKRAFDQLAASEEPFVRKEAPFGSANCQAVLAKHLDPNEAFSERVEALKSAVRSYEHVLDETPEHGRAATNLNHVRYELKRMLQQPPPQQDESKEGDESQESEEGRSQSEGEQGEQEQETEGAEQGDDETQGDEEDAQTDPNDMMNQNAEGQPQGDVSQGEPIDDKNIEAILQSLEDRDKQEQENLRRSKVPPQVQGGKWW